MKIAIFHPFLDNIGGSEIVCLTMARELAADVYTTNIDIKNIEKMGFADILPRIYSIGRVPLNAPFRHQMTLWRFERLDLGKQYDHYFISSDWAVSGALHNKPNSWYVNAPTREIWDLRRFTRQSSVPFLLRPAFDAWGYYNRRLNKKYAAQVGLFISNSVNTKNRLKKFLDKDAVAVYPPIETRNYRFKNNSGYWLAVNRLIIHKRVDIQLKTFSKLPSEKLVIVGSYEKSRHFLQYARYCRKIMPANVKILSWVARNDLLELYAKCIGFITTSKTEDFGMTAVEAMAAGKPVIAPNEGGYKESVIDGKTGILINDIEENKLAAAIKKIGTDPEIYKDACFAQAEKFDTAVFVQKIKELIGAQIK
jgi:glycosyltransferase involved in cell wall biosynthesis